MVNQGMTTEPLEQTPCGGSQVRDSGQQWTPSLQQTACTTREKTHGNGYINQSRRLSEGPAAGSEVGVTDVGQRAAAPSAALLHEAAGGVSGAARVAVARVPVRTSQMGKGLLQLGRDFLERRELPQPGEAGQAGTVARLLGHVAHVALWTAVLAIAAANGLRRRRMTTTDIMISATVAVYIGMDDAVEEKSKSDALNLSLSRTEQEKKS